MQHVILIVSPDDALMNQIRSHLEEGGRYQVTVASSAHEAMTLANSNFFEVAILDGEIEDIPIVPFSRDLCALQSDLKILVFPAANDPNDTQLSDLVCSGFLSKPFSGTEISKALSGLFADQPGEIHGEVKVLDELVKQWLEIPETGSKKAEQIVESTSAETALIIIKGRTSASAGNMDESTDERISNFLTRYWREDENSELARYLRMDGEGSERLVYATRLVSNVVLVLVFPLITTIQQIRRELKVVKEDFQKHYPTTGELRQEIARQALVDINQRSKALESKKPFAGAISQDELDMLKMLNGTTSTAPSSLTVDQSELDALNQLLDEMPTPDPAASQEVQPETPAPTEAAQSTDWLNEFRGADNTEALPVVTEQVPDEQSTPPFIEQTPPPSLQAVPEPAENVMQSTIPAAEEAPDQEDFVLPWEDEGADGDALSTQPAAPLPPLATETASIPDEQSIPAQSDAPLPNVSDSADQSATVDEFAFNYTCVLIPSNRSQFLARDLADKLGAILPEFHLAQGWQMTSITIRPQYLLWTISLPIGACPHQIIHDIRGLTSAHIFANFPEIARTKTSEDFWSDSYLAVSGMEPAPAGLIQDFIARVWNSQPVPAS